MDTKKLRQKILDLAIHGKLVPQDPNDEPASVLLERIRAEKERLIKEGKIKRSKKSAKSSDTPHYENEAPFEVPESWEWTTIGEIASSILYGVSESAKETGQYRLLRITDIQNNRVNWETVPFTDYDNNKAQAYLLNDGDILFARTGATVGKSYLVEGLREFAIYASYLIRVQTSSVILPAYIKFFFESGFYWEQISLNSVGIGQPNVNGTTLAALTIPIPPYREQLRIVEETKKWLSVIDELDLEIDDLQTFIAQAKSKILDLAIHGKLVPQDPNDEPAIELLKRVNSKFTPCDNAHYENNTIEIPENWEWVKLSDIAVSELGKTLDKGKNSGTPHNYLCAFNVKWCSFDLSVIKKILLEDEELERYLVRKGDLLICEGGDVGRAAIWESDQDIYYQNALHRVRFKDEINQYFYLYVLQYYKSLGMIDDVSGGVTIKHFTQNSMKKLSFPLPPIKEQYKIVSAINQYNTILDNISANL